ESDDRNKDKKQAFFPWRRERRMHDTLLAQSAPQAPRGRSRRHRTGVSAKLIATAKKALRFLRLIEGCRRPATEVKTEGPYASVLWAVLRQAIAYTVGLPAYNADSGCG